MTMYSGKPNFSVQDIKHDGHAKLDVVARAMTVIGRHGEDGVSFTVAGEGSRTNGTHKYRTIVVIPSSFQLSFWAPGMGRGGGRRRVRLVGAVVVSSGGSTTQDLTRRLTSCSRIDITNVTCGKFSKLAVIDRRRPSLVFLSMRLPSVSKLSFLSHISVFARKHYHMIVCATCSRFILPTFHGGTFSMLLGPVSKGRLTAMVNELRGIATTDSNGGRVRSDGGDSSGFLLCAGAMSFQLISGHSIYLFRCGRRIQY